MHGQQNIKKRYSGIFVCDFKMYHSYSLLSNCKKRDLVTWSILLPRSIGCPILEILKKPLKNQMYPLTYSQPLIPRGGVIFN